MTILAPTMTDTLDRALEEAQGLECQRCGKLLSVSYVHYHLMNTDVPPTHCPRCTRTSYRSLS